MHRSTLSPPAESLPPLEHGDHLTREEFERRWENMPDAMVLLEAALGGGARLDRHGYVHGVPELLAEVAASSASNDLHLKRDIYQRTGVREYVVWRTVDGVLDWFILRSSGYEPLAPGPDTIYRSEIFPGLWLDPAALIKGDLLAVMRLAQQAAARPEHASFLARLRKV